MAEEESENPKEAGGGGKGSWLLVVVASLLSAVASAGGAFYLFGTTQSAPPAEAATEAAASQAGFSERVLKLDPFVVNVTGEGYPRYLKLQVALEADSVEARGELEARVDQVRDTIILLLSSKRLADVTDFEGKALLKDDLRQRINALLEDGAVKSVLFTEFVVQ